jgi:release factor glutamine methyltransferase
MTSVAAALAAARAKLPASEARLLLGHVMRQAAPWLIAHGDELIGEDSLLTFASLVARRAGGEPVAYLLGLREFYGREFVVTPAVLIPRPETELLIEVALTSVTRLGIRRSEGEDRMDACTSILDLGTGSGCIAVTLALEVPQAQVSAVDISELALVVARTNAERLGAKVDFRQSDWHSAVAGRKFDILVANPPYIALADPHLGVGDLRFEPVAALTSGADGLDAIRRIVGGADACLVRGGQLWLEHGYDQGETVREMLKTARFVDIEQYRDLAGIVRVTGGRRV